MHTWTDAARKELDTYIIKARAGLTAAGADPDEVLDDLRRHIDEEAAAKGIAIVTHEDVRRIIGRIGPVAPEAPSSGPGGPTAAPNAPATSTTGSFFKAVCVLFGVALPAFTLAFELFSGMCANALFNPVPTVWHMLLVAYVPVMNAVVIAHLNPSGVGRRTVLGWLNAVAVGIAAYYSLLFLPFAPFALMGVVVLGLGLVPLSPYLALIVAIVVRLRLRKLEPAVRALPGLWRGLALALLVLAVLDAPKIVTRAGIQMATSGRQETRLTGIELLRALGSRSQLLRYCYVPDRGTPDLVGFLFSMFGRTVPINDARGVYYRVTGVPFNAMRPPRIRGLRGGQVLDVEQFDFEQAGDQVAARLKGLSLEESRIDGIVDANGGTAYTEWTLAFRNGSAMQREARAQIMLPPGGVVSRLTLWIDGEPREAAFGPRATVKDAYRKVVERRRDPVLITTCGPDRILMQCFPVPPNGGTMKVRIGITSPLALESRAAGLVRAPYFTERNFDVPGEVRHAVWYEGDGPLQSVPSNVTATIEQFGQNSHALRADLTEAQLETPFSFRALRNPAVSETWTVDSRGGGTDMVLQRVCESTNNLPKRLVLVLDASKGMKEHAETVAREIAVLPQGTEVAVIAAGDVVTDLAPPGRYSLDGLDAIAGQYKVMAFIGGCDNVPALLRAWNIAAEKPDSVILWLHATQPVLLSGIESLAQKYERRPDTPILYDIQFDNGPNRIAEQLERFPAVRRAPHFGDTNADCTQVIDELCGRQAHYFFERSTVEGTNAPPAAPRGNDHVARLWARDEISRLSSSRRTADRTWAATIATNYQLVTPISGAVVLETARQYIDAGLVPIDEETAPRVIPEPGVFGVLVLGGAILLRRARQAHV